MRKKNEGFVASMIEEIQLMTESIIPNEAQNGMYTNIAGYAQGPRQKLNRLLVQAMLGCEIKDGKAKFCHKLPNKSEIAEICSLLNDFIDGVENVIIYSLAKPEAQAANDQGNQQTPPSDMNVPRMEVKFNDAVHRVEFIHKVSFKKLNEEIFSKDLLSMTLLNVSDCLKLAAMGEKARRKDSRDKMLIVGGIVLVLTGLTVAGVMIYNHKHNDDELKVGDEVVGGDVPSVNDGDIPEIDDVPQVDIE